MLFSSVTVWFSQLRAGEPAGQSDALEKLWEEYAERLFKLARARLEAAPRQLADEHDIVNSVFFSLCRGAQEGRFQQLRNRDELWWLLLAITKRKVVDHTRRELALKRGGGAVDCESDLARDGSERIVLEQLVASTPTADLLSALDEEHRRLLALLPDDRLREIALARVEGYTVQEIAERLEISKRSVERKLDLIRQAWAKEWDHGSAS
jgi:RNA polymerase sigma factor (sigma-70 family)